MTDKSYLRFQRNEPLPGRKMPWWTVMSTSGNRLGIIKFYGRWRCYAFHPEQETLYNEGCLKELATFCANQTYVWREGRRDLKKVRV